MTQPTGNNPYGTDLAMVIVNGQIDVDPTGRLVSGIDVLVQACLLAVTTNTGSLIGAPDECIDIRLSLSKSMTQAEVSALQTKIRQTLLRDQRVQNASVTCSFNLSTSVMTVVMQVQSALGPFTLTLSISQAAILGMGVLYQ